MAEKPTKEEMTRRLNVLINDRLEARGIYSEVTFRPLTVEEEKEFWACVRDLIESMPEKE